MNVYELFLVVLAAFVVGNVVNILIVNPLINKIQMTLFGWHQHQSGSKNIIDSAQSGSSLIVK